VAIWSLTAKLGGTWCDNHRPDNLAELVDLPKIDDPPVLISETEDRLVWGRTILDWGWGYPPYRPLPLEPEDGCPVLPAFVHDDGQVNVWCIYCGAWHHHGGGDGHRAAHCSHPDSPYRETGYVLRQVGLVCRDTSRCDEIAGGIGDLTGLPLCAEHWHEERFGDKEEEAA